MGDVLPDWMNEDTVADADINDIRRTLENNPSMDPATAYEQNRDSAYAET